MKKQISRIRSIGLTKINQLVRAAGHLQELKPAFAEWIAGEIYVCKKTGTYRYRFGVRGKSVAPWSATAEKLFSSPAAFAFAAVVLGGTLKACITRAEQIEREARPALPAARVNVIEMAKAA
ncbi:MAG TPA: hypothetical protein VHW03_09965 [Chthoniobacterales bacterium]|jgi:hypothetical protein|nr:hypothetical protein [Chthoniobacterales bacterium]